MIRSLIDLLARERTTPTVRQLLLLGLSGAAAFAIGFVLVSPQQAEPLITHGGYYFMLTVFSAFCFYAWRVGQARREVWVKWIRRPGLAGAVILAGALFTVWADPFKHKVLFDEYVLQGTAYHMHTTKEVGTIVRAYDLQGTWQPIDTFLDKRPYFFTFLVSLLHDLTGYRIANIFALNVALSPVFLALAYWIAHTLTGRRLPALVAVLLLATMPLLAQQVSGAGMELHNLTMIALEFALAVLWLRAPDRDRLSLLVLGAVLLAQSRYESVIYVVPVAALIVGGWLRAGHVILSWPAVIAPLLLTPYAWHKRIVDSTPLLWQLNEGQTSRFAFQYLPGNLAGAWRFFFNLSPKIANSCYLSLLGLAGLFCALFAAWRWARQPVRSAPGPAVAALLAFSAGILGNLALLMFYYWSHLDDVVASRFALPACFLLAIFAALLVAAGERRFPSAPRYALAGLGVWLLGWGVPALARRSYTDDNLVMQEVEWEHSVLETRPGPVLYMSNKSTIPFVLWRIPTVLNSIGRQRPEHIRFHMQEGTFKEVIVAQALRPTTAAGDKGIDPDDVMPPSFHLEPIIEKRFGGRWMRLSRLVSIDADAKDTPRPGPPAIPTISPAAASSADQQ